MEVVQALMTKDMELIGEMDPYVVLKYQNQKFRTRVHGEGGKTPVWNQTFSIVIKGKTEDINIAVLDEDILYDDVIG